MDATVRKRLLLGRLHQLLLSSTAHGLNKLVQDSNWLVKITWFVIFTSAVCGVSLHTTNLIRLYFSYPVSSTVRQEVNGFEFPDVTICDTMLKKFFLYNVSHYDTGRAERSHMKYAQVIQTLLGFQMGWESKNFLKATYTALAHKFNMSEVSARVQDFLLHCEYNQSPCSFDNFTLYFDKEYGNCFTFRPVSRELKLAGADMGLILVLYPPSVDANFKEDRIMKTTTGLESKGFQVTIHQLNTRPDPHEFGITAPVGMRTDFALSQNKIRLANTSTRPCSPPRRRTFWNTFLKMQQQYVERLYDCIENEVGYNLLKQCNCSIESLIPVDEQQLLNSDYCHDILNMRHGDRQEFERIAKSVNKLWSRYSEDIKKKYAAFIVKLMKDRVSEFPHIFQRLRRTECAYEFSAKLHSSTCLNECRHSEYSSAIALSEWPDRSFVSRGSLIRMKKVGTLLNRYTKKVAHLEPPAALITSLTISNRSIATCQEDSHPNLDPAPLENTTCDDLRHFVSNTLVQVRVYPKTLTTRLLLEERSYELEKLFSDIGGILGLWVGISVITIFEIGEILVLSAGYMYNLLNFRTGRSARLPSSEDSAFCLSAAIPSDDAAALSWHGDKRGETEGAEQQQLQLQISSNGSIHQTAIAEQQEAPLLSPRCAVFVQYDVETKL